MKVGSLVVVLKGTPNPIVVQYAKWIPNMDESTIYTLKSQEHNVWCLEEGIIGYLPDGTEIGIGYKFLREVQPPMDIDIEELISETVEV